MTSPVPVPPPGDQFGPVLRQIGMTEAGGPIYAYRDGGPIVMPAPAAAPARPWGAYVALGIGGAVAVSFLAMAAAILAIAVAIGGVCATVCLLVLRSMWESYRSDREAERKR